jgi:ABC-type multidrug transport system ATPase subunit
MLVITSLSMTLGPRKVLREASLRFAGPGTVWVRGQNGTGKSTLLKCVSGVWRPDRGDVMVCGRSTVDDGTARAQIGYVPDSFVPFPDLTVSEMLSLVAALKRHRPPARQVLDRFGVSAFAHQGVARLSAGQTRRAALVGALIGDPWLLVLDEPTTGLDRDGIALLVDLLRERERSGQAALLVTHDSSFAAQVSREAHDLVDGALVPAAVT